MLKIDTYLGKSSIEGIGLFTNEDINVGDIIIRRSPLTELTYIESELMVLLSNNPKLYDYAWFNRSHWIIDLDDTRHMNHSENPNVHYDSTTKTYKANKFISKGTELTVDYSAFCYQKLLVSPM